MKHTHHWIVSPPNGTDELTGICACGAVRTFPAVPAYSYNGALKVARKRGTENGLMKAKDGRIM